MWTRPTTSTQAPGVVLGEFLVEFTPATVLFDSGASHSYIATSFVEKYGIPSTPLEIPFPDRTVRRVSALKLEGRLLGALLECLVNLGFSAGCRV